MASEFPAQRASNAEMFPFDDVIMTKCFAIALVLLLEISNTISKDTGVWRTNLAHTE